MFSEGDIGVLPPLGVYDWLGLIETRNMVRYEVKEIKHGRAAMHDFLHDISVEAGAEIPTEEGVACHPNRLDCVHGVDADLRVATDHALLLHAGDRRGQRVLVLLAGLGPDR